MAVGSRASAHLPDAHRRFPTTRIYVRLQGEIGFEQWFVVKVPRHGEETYITECGVEIGLPFRFQFDYYFITTTKAGESTRIDNALELRYALADWGQLPANPTLYFEYVFQEDRADKIESKLLLGDELAEGRHWGAHLDFESAAADVPGEARGRVPAGMAHSPWQVIEHMRRAQRDILDFSRHECGRELDWPDDYWPDDPAPPDEGAWDESVRRVLDDRAAFAERVRHRACELLEVFPGGEGQSLAREAITLAQHSSCHLGELVAARRALGAWG